MSSEHTQVTLSGSELHDMTGPICVPSVGPTLLMQLNDIVIALVLSIPITIIIVAAISDIKTYKAKNANSDVMFDCGTLSPFTFTGSTAFGWSMCLNSFIMIFSVITPRIHLNPPLVDPAHEPMNIHTPRITHVI